LTSKPVAVRQIWGAYDQRGRGLLASTALHVVVVVLLFTVLASPHLERAALHSIDLYVPIDTAAFLTALTKESLGGGSGGLNSALPVSRGNLPRFDERQLAPVMLLPVENARLMVDPTLLGPSDLQVTKLDLEWFGDPLAGVGPPSQGPGSGGGFGDKNGTGIGSGDGPGYGPNSGGGVTGVYRIGGHVRAPVLVRRVEPEYSEAARKAKLQGTVVLLIEVWPDGRPHNIRIQNGMGLGLDEAAVKAVEQWRFKPALKGGVPVRVGARVEVYFRLL
jgi:TonB family protein